MFRYVLLSAVPESPRQCRLRYGGVTATRPQIVTAETWKKRFEGFENDDNQYVSGMERFYGDSLRALEYTFKNNLESTSLENLPLAEIADQTIKRLAEENAPRTALLQGPDQAWSLAVMNFVVQASLHSFPSNIRELEDRGYFNPEGREDQRRKQAIERLFQAAHRDPTVVPELAARLKEWNLFADYEDRFFGVVPQK